MTKIYLLAEKAYYTDGTGYIRVAAKTKKSLFAYIKAHFPNAKRGKKSDYPANVNVFEDDDSQTLLEILTVPTVQE